VSRLCTLRKVTGTKCCLTIWKHLKIIKGSYVTSHTQTLLHSKGCAFKVQLAVSHKKLSADSFNNAFLGASGYKVKAVKISDFVFAVEDGGCCVR
jgi:hypothetical protein